MASVGYLYVDDLTVPTQSEAAVRCAEDTKPGYLVIVSRDIYPHHLA